MKKTIIYVFLVAALCSCKTAKEDWVNFETFEGLDPETSFVPHSSSSSSLDSKAILSSSIVGGGTVSDFLDSEQAEEEAEGTDTKTTYTNGAGLFKSIISSWHNSRIRSFCGTYYSVDQDNKKILLSGRIILPADGKVSRIVLVSHFTIGADKEAPSNELPLESIYAARGLCVIVPDYIGYGASADRIHPYLCADVTARNVVDMYCAALPFLKYIGCKPEYDDIFLLGYSQGGATTLSVAHEIEWNHPEIEIRLAMAGGGPYDICTTYDKLVDNDFTDYPCAVPMIIQGMDKGSHLNLDYSNYFLPNMVENMDKWINSKKYAMAEITQMMGSKKLSSIMTEKARNKTEDIMTNLYRVMLDNSVVNDPLPECPLYLFHSYDDNVVPYENMTSLVSMADGYNIIYNVGHYGNHVKGCLRFLYCCVDIMEKNGDI